MYSGDLLKGFLREYEVGKYPLHEAIFEAAKLSQLLERRYDTEGKLPTGETPLHLAAQFGLDAALELLVEAGADVNAVNLKQNTPLHLAIYPTSSPIGESNSIAESKNLQCCIILLAGGAHIDASNKLGMTPLIVGLKTHKEEVVKLLLDSGASVLVFDSEGWTPLHYACFAARPDFVELLLEKGADKSSKTKHGETPAEIANQLDCDFEAQKQAILKLLL